jgi:uncharacterized Zn finger protein
MDPDNYSRSITLYCPTCGGTEFEYDDDTMDEEDAIVCCTSCGNSLTRVALNEANSEHITAHVEEIKEEIVKDISNQISNMFKRKL